jgi:hypothetical protein
MATRKQFTHLTATHPLVEELNSGKHEWWAKLVNHSHKDPDINIQVRGDYLSVYSRMGSLLTVRLNEKKQIVCSIHYKYLIASPRCEYVDAIPSGEDLTVSLPSCDLVTSILDEKNFKRIKQNIARIAGEEKSIQSKLVEKNRNTLLDVEIAFSESGTLIDPEEEEASSSRKTRIDLVNYDKNHNALVFIELKHIFDGRLYSDSKGRKEINDQIAKYKVFAQNHEAEIIKTYNDVIEVKRVLGLLPNDSALKSAIIESVEPRPILAIAAYNQDIIDVRRKLVEKDLNSDNLAALYFFGSAIDLNLPLKKDKNKELFLKIGANPVTA